VPKNEIERNLLLNISLKPYIAYDYRYDITIQQYGKITLKMELTNIKKKTEFVS
jgi:hypothetical protein